MSRTAHKARLSDHARLNYAKTPPNFSGFRACGGMCFATAGSSRTHIDLSSHLPSMGIKSSIGLRRRYRPIALGNTFRLQQQSHSARSTSTE